MCGGGRGAPLLSSVACVSSHTSAQRPAERTGAQIRLRSPSERRRGCIPTSLPRPKPVASGSRPIHGAAGGDAEAQPPEAPPRRQPRIAQPPALTHLNARWARGSANVLSGTCPRPGRLCARLVCERLERLYSRQPHRHRPCPPVVSAVRHLHTMEQDSAMRGKKKNTLQYIQYLEWLSRK